VTRPKQFIALIGGERIPTSAKVIAAYMRANNGRVPFEFIPAPLENGDPEADEPTGADWTAK